MTETDAIMALIALFEREGYARVEPAVLQPADVFVDLSGEDIRRRMFVTQDAAGSEFCLRPEYTIPVCLQHLHTHGAEPAGYSYGGPVFRMRPGESGEFMQAGLESIGRPDASAADAEILGLALEGLEQIGLTSPPIVKLGDMGLLNALIDALKIPPAVKRRVVRAIVSGHGLDSLSEADSQGQVGHAGLAGGDRGSGAPGRQSLRRGHPVHRGHRARRRAKCRRDRRAFPRSRVEPRAVCRTKRGPSSSAISPSPGDPDQAAICHRRISRAKRGPRSRASP